MDSFLCAAQFLLGPANHNRAMGGPECFLIQAHQNAKSLFNIFIVVQWKQYFYCIDYSLPYRNPWPESSDRKNQSIPIGIRRYTRPE